ncbi:MAG: winged helix-turn-helix transcriptional regulator [Candidatus Lokiarchaeota archaeon]|nr:winged helix-turn-helix transcriptional regulator [Candidatus Lokiarchaeota archaeon]MBD3201526.1 winged helix-turn-helix transcriptional regulator [Candidatus Lokiarchaeota archaeon]
MTVSEKLKLDEVDQQIITLIQEDPTLTHSEIAIRINRSQPTVGIRLRKLLKSGAFKIQPGINIKNAEIYMARVKIKTNKTQKVFELAECCPYILNCFSILGDYNLVLLIVSTEISHIEAIINKHFRANEDSKKVLMDIVIDYAKDFVIPIDLEEQKRHNPSDPEKCVEECKFYETEIIDSN